LALGDSYTIGESVCETCRFPVQLKQKLDGSNLNKNISLEIIAKTGWTTTDLLKAIEVKKPSSNYDLVTLLIGVNNQYQNKDFRLYEKEFAELVTKATIFAKGDRKNVIVLSIPDYAYTPYGDKSGKFKTITTELAKYNAFAKKYCQQLEIRYINITDITKEGLKNPKLTATDGLHPSKVAYSKFVDRIVPTALQVIK
jgi:lysophospholipase L1-like esterase